MSKEKLEKIMKEKERRDLAEILATPEYKKVNILMFECAILALLCGAIVAILKHFKIFGG